MGYLSIISNKRIGQRHNAISHFLVFGPSIPPLAYLRKSKSSMSHLREHTEKSSYHPSLLQLQGPVAGGGGGIEGVRGSSLGLTYVIHIYSRPYYPKNTLLGGLIGSSHNPSRPTS